MTKNVAEEIFEKLCESVATSLEAKKLASFTRISSTVQGLDDDAALQVMKLYEELVELWPDGATMELNALYVEQKIGRGHCTAGIRSRPSFSSLKLQVVSLSMSPFISGYCVPLPLCYGQSQLRAHSAEGSVFRNNPLLSKLTRQLSIHDNRAAAASGTSDSGSGAGDKCYDSIGSRHVLIAAASVTAILPLLLVSRACVNCCPAAVQKLIAVIGSCCSLLHCVDLHYYTIAVSLSLDYYIAV
ncbi:hypothetical protein Vadar_015900 [Vaccinium darrowii]|uniref:Uncharacterized protein n=1 Tax=Vaccinium darrowii TaxID=229202 RepID=A0ACB7YN42_9ERIC|nr:hypothetical protein Vadar_015900 [Vaccinium darrowii]